jgi:hypothetical protein
MISWVLFVSHIWHLRYSLPSLDKVEADQEYPRQSVPFGKVLNIIKPPEPPATAPLYTVTGDDDLDVNIDPTKELGFRNHLVASAVLYAEREDGAGGVKVGAVGVSPRWVPGTGVITPKMNSVTLWFEDEVDIGCFSTKDQSDKCTIDFTAEHRSVTVVYTDDGVWGHKEERNAGSNA